MLDPLASSSPKTLDDDEEEDVGNSFDSSNSMASIEEWTLRIKSFRDVEIQIPSNSVVSQVKDRIRAALKEKDRRRYMRLICKGRLLTPDHAPIQEFNVRNGDAVHAVLATATTTTTVPAANGTTSTSPTSGNRQRRRQRGTVVGPGGRVTRASLDNESSSSSDDDEEEGRERLGFDRLRMGGLSRQEITAIRSYFSRHVDRYVQQHPESHPEESDLRRRRLLIEDDWMALQGPTSEFRLNLNQNTLMRFANVQNTPSGGFRSSTTIGTDGDFVWGFVLGFFVGFVMLIWVWMPNIPHKQKLGILTGLSFQLAFNVVQEETEDEFDQD